METATSQRCSSVSVPIWCARSGLTLPPRRSPGTQGKPSPRECRRAGSRAARPGVVSSHLRAARSASQGEALREHRGSRRWKSWRMRGANPETATAARRVSPGPARRMARRTTAAAGPQPAPGRLPPVASGRREVARIARANSPGARPTCASSSRTRCSMRGRPAFETRHQAHVPGHGEMREQTGLLDGVADAPPKLDRIPVACPRPPPGLRPARNISPFTILSAVVLPEPLRPSRTSVSPS